MIFFRHLLNRLFFSGCLLILLALLACGGERRFKRAEDAQDAGREFIRASLDGDFEKAQFYMLPDTTNLVMINRLRRDYSRYDKKVQEEYHGADILPINIQTLNDSTTLYTYSNSYKKDTSTLRIVRVQGEWLVDLKEILNSKKP